MVSFQGQRLFRFDEEALLERETGETLNLDKDGIAMAGVTGITKYLGLAGGGPGVYLEEK
jgi:hypothetical protein